VPSPNPHSGNARLAGWGQQQQRRGALPWLAPLSNLQPPPSAALSCPSPRAPPLCSFPPPSALSLLPRAPTESHFALPAPSFHLLTGVTFPHASSAPQVRGIASWPLTGCHGLASQLSPRHRQGLQRAMSAPLGMPLGPDARSCGSLGHALQQGKEAGAVPTAVQNRLLAPEAASEACTSENGALNPTRLCG